MKQWISHSAEETEGIGESFAQELRAGDVVALFGGLGMGKTAFVRGLARGLGITADVSSPTYALVHEYAGKPSLYHFDMYRVNTWDDLHSAGFFYYLSLSGIVVVEWSENIEGALPDTQVYRITIQSGRQEDERLITAVFPEDEKQHENFSS